MRRTLLATVVLVLLLPGTAGAHLVAKPKGDTLAAVAASQKENLGHARYVARYGAGPHVVWHKRAQSWLAREYAETVERIEARRMASLSPQAAICTVFGSYCQQALAVARCESGFSIYARNGQYLGLFQMGDYARGRYGHSWNALGQARSAYAYFRDAGGWGPWECKPY